ncbi:PREDICTED: protein NLRC3-like [Poecilia mexicana]|uniref:NACHT domain-containing protein n=1 Tax=Poecilia mexicana TaxID=48701 RepID=A0A3B3Y1D7_9TELE|nr:PREDICTED: protein NLRC3-like [Poecilia mexicana]XP_014849877.1 PREDICTED: protein NLRC3-like [Poecilia mexicana]
MAESMLSDNSSIGDAVSSREDVEFIEDEDLYYIPERRPSLDLGPSPMDTSQWHFVDQALTPAQSYEKLTSEDEGVADQEGPSTSVRLERAESFSSCYSVDSNDCEKIIPKEKTKEEVTEPSNQLELIQEPEEIKHPSLTLQFTFKALCETLKKLPEDDFRMFKWKLWTHYPQPFSASQSMDIVDLVDRLLESFTCEMSVQITRTILVSISKKNVAEHLRMLYIKNQIRHELCELMIQKYSEVSITEGQTMPLDDIYVDVNTFSRSDNGPNVEHEVLQITKAPTKKKPGDRLSLAETLSQEWITKTYARQVYLYGLAGSGKSMFVKKLALDWARGRSHQHFSFVYVITIREMNEYLETKISLMDIVNKLYPMAKRIKTEGLRYEENEALFIFDGLDEYPEEFNFMRTEIHSDASSPMTMRVLLVNLLRGRFLSRSRFVITSRPHADRCAPWDGHYDEIEMGSFSNANKDEYFRKRFKDPNQAARVIEHVKSLKTLHIMCCLPLFCMLLADEYQRVFRESPEGKLPTNMTYMYTKLLLKLVHIRRTRKPAFSPEDELKLLMDLGKFAFTLLEKGQFHMNRSKCPDFSHIEAVNRSGICMQYTTTPFVLCHEDVVCFLHPTVQEYMAALYAYLSFRNHDKNIFDQSVKNKLKLSHKGHRITELYKAAVEKSLQCPDGKLDLFLRFLFGMGCKTNQELLLPFHKPSAKVLDLVKDCAALIKKNQGSPHPDRSKNLKCCLEELEM